MSYTTRSRPLANAVRLMQHGSQDGQARAGESARDRRIPRRARCRVRAPRAAAAVGSTSSAAFRRQEAAVANKLAEDARALQDAGADIIVLPNACEAISARGSRADGAGDRHWRRSRRGRTDPGAVRRARSTSRSDASRALPGISWKVPRASAARSTPTCARSYDRSYPAPEHCFS